MGVFGLIDPDTQAQMMGFPSVPVRPSGDHTATLLMITSLATINTALLYLIGAVRSWPGFLVWVLAARFLMGAGLGALALSGTAPVEFIGAAVWEWAGALAIGAAGWWDRRR
jgi:hypothetical protein